MTGLRGEQGENKVRCIAMHFYIHIANLWFQKNVTFIFCTIEFIINQNSSSKNTSGYFSMGICTSKNQQDLVKTDSDASMVPTQF